MGTEAAGSAPAVGAPIGPAHATADEVRTPPGLAFSVPVVDLQMRFGQSDAREVWLTGERVHEARIRVVTIDPPTAHAQVMAREDGGTPGLRISVDGAAVGRGVGRVEVTTGVADPSQLTLLFGWKVIGNLTVEPSNPVLDLRAPAPEVTIRVSSARTDFRVASATVVDGPFRVQSWQSDSPKEGATSGGVVIKVVSKPAASEQHGFLGTLRLVSNDPAEPQKDVSLFAFGPASGAPF